MLSPLLLLPKSWRTSVTVVRPGPTDNRGNHLPPTEIPREDVLIAPRATSDPVDRSDVTDGRAVLYDADLEFTYSTADTIVVPPGARMAGRWKVDGRPAAWPFGWEIGLVPA